MTNQDNLFSPTANFHYFIMSVWPWISLERDSYWIWIMNTSYRKYHSNPVLVTPFKSTDTVIYIYDGQLQYLKKIVDKWTSIDVVMVECLISIRCFT